MTIEIHTLPPLMAAWSGLILRGTGVLVAS